MHRQGKKLPVAADNSVVNAPGVDADTVESACIMGKDKPLFYLAVNGADVPASQPVADNMGIFEAVDFLESDLAAGKLCKHCPSA